MPAPLTPIKAFTNEPFRSIINLLIEFETTGLRLKDIQYALIENHSLYAIKKQKAFLDVKLKDLIQSGRFKKYKIKSIRKKKRKEEGKTEDSEKAKRARNVTLSFLNELKRIGAVCKDGHRYKIDKRFFYEGARIQNKESLDFFPGDKIMLCSVKPHIRKHLLYGLSAETYDKLDDDDKEAIQNSLEKIRENIVNIGRIKGKALDKKVEERISVFISEKKLSEKIKKAFKNNGGYNFWVAVQDVFILKSNWNSQGMWDVGSAGLISKDVFYEGMGWPFGVKGGKYPISTPEYIPVGKDLPIVLYGEDLYKFFRDTPEELSKDDVAEYRRLWSEHFFPNNYDFSSEEIEELIKWGWDSRDLFYEYFPLSIAFSSYKEYRPSLLVPRLQFAKKVIRKTRSNHS